MRLRSSCLLSCALFFGVHTASSAVMADGYDAPSAYYVSATGWGASLKHQLHNIIDHHQRYSYDSLRSILQVTDADVDNPGHIILAYTRESLDVSRLGGSIPGWDSGNTWNREHTWPRSRGVDSSGPDNTDLHSLRPIRSSLNGSRGNLNFGGAYGSNTGRVSDGGTVWYPGDEDAGMVARQMMYMDVRYDGGESSTSDLTLVSGNPGSSGSQLGNLSRMLEWHYEVVPDAFERRRNDVIFDSYQRNRNPFVDHPEYAWSIFVDQANDTQLSFGGASADGGSLFDQDFGRVIVGATGVHTTAAVTLTKTGDDGVYYSVSTSGSATSDVLGRNHAFAMGRTGERVLNVGVDADLNTVGVYSGEVVVDNLDITTEGGMGRGGNDGDDIVEVSITVVEHSNASFEADRDEDVLVLDFGEVAAGQSASLDFSVFNYALTSLTAGLDFDASSVTLNGDAGAFDLDVPDFDALGAGDSASWSASFGAGMAGDYQGVVVFDFADEALPGGAGGQTLTLALTGTVVIPEPGVSVLLSVLAVAMGRRRVLA